MSRVLTRRRILVAEAGKTDTVCWSSIQNGMSGSVLATLMPADLATEFASASEAFRRPATLSASIGQNKASMMRLSHGAKLVVLQKPITFLIGIYA
jgi:hypothetical protein